MTHTRTCKATTRLYGTRPLLHLGFGLLLLLLVPAGLSADTRFKPVQTHSLGAMYPSSVEVGDLNNDGKPDLVVVGSQLNTGRSVVEIFEGNGDGTFHLIDTLTFPAQFATSVKIADMNRDGNMDLVVANCGSTYIYGCPNGSNGVVAILLGNGDGSFGTPTTYDSGGGMATSIAVADLNLDGKLDVLVGNGCSDKTCTKPGGVEVLLGNGDGSLQLVVAYNGVGQGSIAVADVNQDGKSDVVLGGPGIGVTVLLGKGDGTFQQSGFYSVGGYSGPSFVLADINHDGKTDVVGVGSSNNPNSWDGSVRILLGNGDGTFQPVIMYPSGGELSQSVAVADLNGDGRPDIVTTNCEPTGWPGCDFRGPGGVVGVLSSNPNGTFQWPTTFLTGGHSANSIAIADLNGDTRPDLVVTNFFGQNLGVLMNDGPYPTSSTLASSLNPSIYGQSVRFTAKVTSRGSLTPTGKVAFRWSQDGRVFDIGTALLDANGVAALTRSALNVNPFGAPYPLTAVYVGDLSNGDSTSSVLSQSVLQAKSVAKIISSANPAPAGQPVTFTANITSPTVKVTGPVTFSLGGVVLGSVQLWGPGTAKFTTSTLPIGISRITVTYHGNSNVARSSASILQTVQ